MGKGRAPCCDKTKVKKGPWSPAEDLRLITFIQNHGHSNWRALPKQAGLLRCGKSCRLRWINYLRPDVKRGNFTPEEEQTIVNLHNSIGNKWSKIASYLPGRTDNEIKNVWNTHLKKRVVTKKTADEAQHSKTKTNSSASPCTSSSVTSFGDQGVQESKAKILNSTHDPSDDHNESKETSASSDSPTSSSRSNFFNTSRDSRPNEDIVNPDHNGKIEIPLESADIDFWELFDSLQDSDKTEQINGGNQDSTSPNPADKLDFGYECSKWFRLLENELGLTSEDVDNLPQEIMDLEPEIIPGLDYFPIWPSSPQNLGI